MRKRARITETQDKDIFGRVIEQPRKSGRDEEEYARRYGRPTTYRLPDEVRDAVKKLAEKERVSVSVLVEEALIRFLEDVRTGRYKIKKEPAFYKLARD